MALIKELYRTNTSVMDACETLGIEFEVEMLGDLEACTNCGVWWYSYELTPDLDDNNICRFCEGYYGR
jgi:hypothetical protein